MELQETRCCAVLEIDGLSDHSSPEDAMKSVCERLQEMEEDNRGWGEDDDKPKSLIPPGFIIFTGVVKCEKGAHRGCQTGYGEKFEALIRKERLGLVSGSCVRTNRINHPEHQVKVWTWAPSVKGLNRWWKLKQKGGR